MLTELHIENIAVIQRADVSFGEGFNVLTGETGAGKSILIDAIGAVLGGRVSRDLVRTGAERALVSAVFTGAEADAWLEENGVEPEGEELILQRRISADGKSACRVCGVPVTAQQLRSLGGLLLDIHGQNDGRQLLDEARHLDYLDRFGETEEERAAFSAAYARWRSLRKEAERLSMDELEKERLTAQLTAEIRELEQAKLQPGEEEELQARRDRMKNGEKLSEALEGARQALSEAEASAIALTEEAERHIAAAVSMAPELAPAAKSAEDARFLLEDAAERVNDLLSSLDFSEAEFEEMESRLALLRRLQRRYGEGEAELLERLDRDRSRLEELESAEGLLLQLEKEEKQAKAEALAAGAKLTEKRKAASEALAVRVQAELRELSMPSVTFVTEITPLRTPEGFDATGCDQVRFLMSANAGAAPGRIAHIASGGELSRIMLALKSVFAEKDPVGALIFDEIDTGVSGVAAQRVGEKMAALARRRQIICVTHLPQIAALADSQFYIEKGVSDGATRTTVRELDHDGRVRELARLYGGDAVTETTRASAEEQLSAAAAYKSSLKGVHTDDGGTAN